MEERDDIMQTLEKLITLNKKSIYARCEANTTRDGHGRAVLPIGDEWRDETEWDELYEELKNAKNHKAE